VVFEDEGLVKRKMSCARDRSGYLLYCGSEPMIERNKSRDRGTESPAQILRSLYVVVIRYVESNRQHSYVIGGESFGELRTSYLALLAWLFTTYYFVCHRRLT